VSPPSSPRVAARAMAAAARADTGGGGAGEMHTAVKMTSRTRIESERSVLSSGWAMRLRVTPTSTGISEIGIMPQLRDGAWADSKN